MTGTRDDVGSQLGSLSPHFSVGRAARTFARLSLWFYLSHDVSG